MLQRRSGVAGEWKDQTRDTREYDAKVQHFITQNCEANTKARLRKEQRQEIACLISHANVSFVNKAITQSLAEPFVDASTQFRLLQVVEAVIRSNQQLSELLSPVIQQTMARSTDANVRDRAKRILNTIHQSQRPLTNLHANNTAGPPSFVPVPELTPQCFQNNNGALEESSTKQPGKFTLPGKRGGVRARLGLIAKKNKENYKKNNTENNKNHNRPSYTKNYDASLHWGVDTSANSNAYPSNEPTPSQHFQPSSCTSSTSRSTDRQQDFNYNTQPAPQVSHPAPPAPPVVRPAAVAGFTAVQAAPSPASPPAPPAPPGLPSTGCDTTASAFSFIRDGVGVHHHQHHHQQQQQHHHHHHQQQQLQVQAKQVQLQEQRHLAQTQATQAQALVQAQAQAQAQVQAQAQAQSQAQAQAQARMQQMLPAPHAPPMPPPALHIEQMRVMIEQQQNQLQELQAQWQAEQQHQQHNKQQHECQQPELQPVPAVSAQIVPAHAAAPALLPMALPVTPPHSHAAGFAHAAGFTPSVPVEPVPVPAVKLPLMTAKSVRQVMVQGKALAFLPSPTHERSAAVFSKEAGTLEVKRLDEEEKKGNEDGEEGREEGNRTKEAGRSSGAAIRAPGSAAAAVSVTAAELAEAIKAQILQNQVVANRELEAKMRRMKAAMDMQTLQMQMQMMQFQTTMAGMDMDAIGDLGLVALGGVFEEAPAASN